MATQMMPTTAMYMSSEGSVQMQSNSVAPVVTYVYVVPAVPRTPRIAEKYLSRQSRGLGITLIVIGVLTSIFNGVGLAVRDDFAVIGHGFWCGAMFIVTGSFGIAAANKKTCFIITFMVLSILSAVITGCLLGFGIGGAIRTSSRYGYGYRGYGYNQGYNGHDGSSYNYNLQDSIVAMESLLAFLGVVAAVVSIWGSAIGCRAVCCCVHQYSSMVSDPYGNQQVMFINQQQQQSGVVQYAMPQMMPMTISSPSYAQQHSVGNVNQQQQQHAAPDYQPPGYAFASLLNVDQMSYSVIDQPSPMTRPPEYALNEQK